MNPSKGYWVQFGVGSLKQNIEAEVQPDVRPINFRHSIYSLMLFDRCTTPGAVCLV